MVAFDSLEYFGYDRNMIGNGYIAGIAALIGDSSRANILFALKSDDQVNAGDLARIADISNSTASEHLEKLVQGGLVTFVKHGRQKYFRLSNTTVSEILENLENFARASQLETSDQGQWDQVHVHARKCMDHIAGRLGCGIAGRIIERGYVRFDRDGAQLSDDGAYWFKSFGIDPAKLDESSRQLVNICPDWVENTPHLGGSIGAALMNNFISRDWIRRNREEGTVRITPKGSFGFRQEFDLNLRAST